MFQFPLLSSILQGSAKGLTADPIQPEGGLMALLRVTDSEIAGFTGELQAMLMQLAPPVLQRLDELLAGGKSLPEAARALLSEFASEGGGQPFPDLLHKLAQSKKTAETVRMPEPLPSDSFRQPSEPLPRVSAAPVPPLPAETLLPSPTTAATTSPLGAITGGIAASPAGAMPTALQLHIPPQLASNLLDMGVPQQVGSKAWTEAVAQRVMWMVQGDQQFASLKLNPPNLGPLEVRVSVNQDQTNVAFLAQHAPVREALEAALPRLREMFEQSSLQLVRADVSDPGTHQRGSSNGSAAEHALRHGAGRDADPGDAGFSSDERQAVGRSGLVDLFA